jgi:hypothetical protein
LLVWCYCYIKYNDKVSAEEITAVDEWEEITTSFTRDQAQFIAQAKKETDSKGEIITSGGKARTPGSSLVKPTNP